jgi:alanine-glyoxylate transaminase/serine-glyoxylate transaminase/serine-pyruvate transaminase
MPEGHSEIRFREIALKRFNLSLGSGLTKLRDKVFRIGHLGDFNDLMLMGTLAGIEMTLDVAQVPHKKGGVDAAMDYLAHGDSAQGKKRVAA